MPRIAKRCAADPGSIAYAGIFMGPGSAEQREGRCTASGTRCQWHVMRQWLSLCETAGETEFCDPGLVRIKQALLRFHGDLRRECVYTPFIAILKLLFNLDRS